MTTAPAGAHDTRHLAIGVVVALALHAGGAAILGNIDGARTPPPLDTVEFEVPEAPPPPPPEAEPEPPPPPPEPAPPRPRVVARREPPPPKPVAKPTEIPPPNQTPPADAPKQAPPVFGVTMSSVVGGDATMAVPVGNTTMTRDRTAKAGDTPPAPYVGEPSATFQPVPDVFVTVQPTVLYEVNSEDIYPPDARALGIEGVVKLSVGIDAGGNVVQVRVVSRAGHGFDEAATKAMRRFRFSPARTNDGHAVPYRFVYTYRFESQ